MEKRISWLLIGAFLVASLWVGYASTAARAAVGPVTLKVLNPRGEIEPPPTLAPTPRVTDFAGKKIGIYWNGKMGGDNFWNVAEELVKEKFPTAKILRYKGAFDLGDKLAATLAKECDAVIYGVGD